MRISKKTAVRIIIPVVILAVIVAEVSVISSYHSGCGGEQSTIGSQGFNQSELLIISKLPGVSARVLIYVLQVYGPEVGYSNATATPPQNSSIASVSMQNFNSSKYAPSILVTFNATASPSEPPSILQKAVNVSLTGNIPVSISMVTEGDYPGLVPSVVVSNGYDYLVISIDHPVDIQYGWVSR